MFVIEKLPISHRFPLCLSSAKLRAHQLIDVSSLDPSIALLLLLQNDAENLDRWSQTQLICSNPALHACHTDAWLRNDQHKLFNCRSYGIAVLDTVF